MTFSDFFFLPIMIFWANFIFGYVMLALFAFIRRSLW